jgi:DNA modification methylase
LATADYIGNITQGDNVEILRNMDAESVDLTVTSPPYDNLRAYNGYSFDFESVAQELYRVTKPGGVVVWIVGDATVNGSETLTSFKQALYFRDIGLNVHDTMIWNKGSFSAVGSLQTRYAPVFEYMFVISKGKPKTFNPIKDHKNIHAGRPLHGTLRNRDGSIKPASNIGKPIAEYGQRFNVWEISPHRIKQEHPAIFPEALAQDHVISWSNPGDIVLDPFGGSGTTAKMALLNGRRFIHIDVSAEYCEIARKRLESIA